MYLNISKYILTSAYIYLIKMSTIFINIYVKTMVLAVLYSVELRCKYDIFFWLISTLNTFIVIFIDWLIQTMWLHFLNERKTCVHVLNLKILEFTCIHLVKLVLRLIDCWTFNVKWRKCDIRASGIVTWEVSMSLTICFRVVKRWTIQLSYIF